MRRPWLLIPCVLVAFALPTSAEEPEGETAKPWRVSPAFAGRVDHPKRSVEGGAAVEVALKSALDWLARHQDPAGHWDGDGFSAQCKDAKCGGHGYALFDPAVSGLALLAFLAAGETDRAGPHRQTVKRGLAYLQGLQDEDGCFGPRTTVKFVYNHAIATLALAEAYALTGDPTLKRPTQRAVDFIVKCQNPYLAWRYGVRPQDNDTSVTAWMTSALRSARAAGGLKVPKECFHGARAWLEKVTEPEYGKAGYTSRGTGPGRPQDLMDRFPSDRSESLTAHSVYLRVLLGEDPRHSEMVQKSTELCLKVLPDWDEDGGGIDMIYWYWGTLAMFQVGGEAFETWNEAFKDTALLGQRKSGGASGSWDPVGPWGREGGRVYSTAVMALSLAVYDRYARLYENFPKRRFGGPYNRVDRRVIVDVVNAPATEVFLAMGKFVGLPVVFAPGSEQKLAKRTVTLAMRKVPGRCALNLLSELVDATWERTGDTITVRAR